MPATLLNTAIALPDHRYTQQELGRMIATWLAADPDKAAKAAAILRNAEIDVRHTVRPLPWYLAHTSVTERSAVYREEMIRLCERAARAALEGAGVEPGEIGLLVTTSCTGVMIPSVDAYLLNRLPFGAETRRLPLTELGCVAGAAALAHAEIHLRAFPESAALVVSAELASLTAQVDDRSMTNVISTAIFADGAAATVMAGERFRAVRRTVRGARAAPEEGPEGRPEAGPLRPRIVAVRSIHFPDSIRMMGFDNTDGGLKIVLSPQVPRFVRQELPAHLEAFLRAQGLRLEDIRHFLLHPGGRKVIEGLEQRLGLTRAQTGFSRDVLRRYGNLSSATVLAMLHHFEREARPAPGDLGLLMAVGPGFCAECLLLRW